MALGARPHNILSVCLRRGLLPLAVGLAIGFAAALPLVRFLSPLLYEVRSFDPGVFAGVALLLGITGGLAGFIPAYRSLSVDPGAALKSA